MQILELTNKTRTLSAPSNWDDVDGKCSGLDIFDLETKNGNLMLSMWKPSVEDVKNLIEGANIVVGIYGTNHPVICIRVE
jgi:hypothetical protein